MYQFFNRNRLNVQIMPWKKKIVFQLIKLPSKEVSNTERSNNALKQKNVHSFMTQESWIISPQFLLSVTTKFISS